jgi:hypothetical protein
LTPRIDNPSATPRRKRLPQCNALEVVGLRKPEITKKEDKSYI